MKTYISQYSIYKEDIFKESKFKNIKEFCNNYSLDGVEVFMDDIII